MDTSEKILTIFLLFATVLRNCKSEWYSENQRYFKKIRDYGSPLSPEDIISEYSVHTEIYCSLKCLEEQVCLAYNYRQKSKKHEINCQTSWKTNEEGGQELVSNGEWVFYQEMTVTFPFSPALNENEWTLIARFSNNDTKNWINNASFWYDRITPHGEVKDPLVNLDMISEAFWKKKGKEIKITRSDDSSHIALLQTTSNCLQGKTFRSKITSYGNFRKGTVWASDQCLGSCAVIYGGQYKTTAGFEQHSCNGFIQSSNYIGFWCDWHNGDGAVMMIGGGGGLSCARADHGVGITELNAASFGKLHYAFDFGTDANVSAVVEASKYSLNLWIR